MRVSKWSDSWANQRARCDKLVLCIHFESVKRQGQTEERDSCDKMGRAGAPVHSFPGMPSLARFLHFPDGRSRSNRMCMAFAGQGAWATSRRQGYQARLASGREATKKSPPRTRAPISFVCVSRGSPGWFFTFVQRSGSSIFSFLNIPNIPRRDSSLNVTPQCQSGSFESVIPFYDATFEPAMPPTRSDSLKCSQCGRIFTRREHLKRHIRIRLTAHNHKICP